MLPVATSTSNMTHEWSVEAPARPARKQADSTSTPPSSREEASAGRWCRLAREAVTRRRVERGATGGSSLAIEGAFERAGCRIQSPPCAALQKVWSPRPPSSLRCLTTIARSEREGEAATPCRSHAARNTCLSYGDGSGKALGRFREGRHTRGRGRGGSPRGRSPGPRWRARGTRRARSSGASSGTTTSPREGSRRRLRRASRRRSRGGGRPPPAPRAGGGTTRRGGRAGGSCKRRRGARRWRGGRRCAGS
mmetsp:Transcript_51353/g.171392  ORF Transcript_51353/g.171392 Transcript_51353/m.171392 type:complete len:251 (+) Transcript_51353:894-1646(+)